MMSRLKNDRGQAFVVMALTLAMAIGMAALALDVGHWFRDKRRLQGTADAAALAGAQMLPNSAANAQSTAMTYANTNGGNVAAGSITVSSQYMTNDTITVNGLRVDSGIFSGVLGVANVNITAHAKARVGPPAQALAVAPMVVNCGHSLIQNCNNNHTPQFNVPTTLDFNALGAPGAFGMLNLDGGNGTPGASEEGQWILHGFDKYLPLGKYRSDPGAKFSSSNVQSALTARKGTVLLFPVYDKLTGNGQNAQYNIIGWIGFYLTDFNVHGNTATLKGYFTQYIAQGILAQASPGSGGVPSSLFGVKSIQLVE